jgi:phosphoglycolate phosphatase
LELTSQTPRPQALLFDWDNTLVDTWGVIHEALNTTLIAFDKTPWTLDETRTKVRKSTRDSFPGLFGDKWEAAMEVFYQRYAEIHKIKLEAATGAAEMLETMHDRGFYMAVVSNKRGDFLRAEVEYFGWDRFFMRIVGATDAARDKPAKEPILMALNEGGIEPSDGVWYIGDADIDLNCAHQSGCHPVLLREKPPGEGEFAEFPPARHFTDCMALCKFVDNL